ncbi:MAG: tRNA pseudouridine(55) synthase TruB [Candidatus Eisenbacteria bacterium]|uniref:tRNA pseudouridine synthase B n=1 Tax=Eiseniibacteriota bacterium TaxID=2212470 RepID=A0A538TY25_UNCEI|nr:MAG: tRNA pseudouridine(55) synthase TruB [Candidatus Eisenbacteria bacterium]
MKHAWTEGEIHGPVAYESPRPIGAAAPAWGPESAGALGFSGLLAVDKPVGVTSHDVVVKVRRRLKSPGAGHLGTLDPGASGLLLIALGAATRAIAVWQGGEKTYEGTALFGLTTTTQDIQGDVTERREVALSEEAVREASRAFAGTFDQIPPMVSALKVSGRRLHQLARRGVTVERRPRRVIVHAWEWIAFDLPRARFRVRCASGTYVRTLVHDLGQALGTGAALESLRRLRSEPFGLDHAVRLGDLDELPPHEVLAKAGRPLDESLAVLPAVTLEPAAALRIGAGGRPAVTRGDAPLGGGPRSVVLRDGAGHALALGELHAHPEDPALAIACPRVVFPWAVRTGRGA